MTDFDPQAANATLAQMLRERLGVRRGETLEEKLQHAGRAVPKHLRRSTERLVEAERLWGNPKLRRHVDPVAYAFAEGEVKAWLDTIDAADRRKGIWLGILASLAFNFMLITAGVIGYLAYIGWF